MLSYIWRERVSCVGSFTDGGGTEPLTLYSIATARPRCFSFASVQRGPQGEWILEERLTQFSLKTAVRIFWGATHNVWLLCHSFHFWVARLTQDAGLWRTGAEATLQADVKVSLSWLIVAVGEIKRARKRLKVFDFRGWRDQQNKKLPCIYSIVARGWRNSREPEAFNFMFSIVVVWRKSRKREAP